MVPVARSRSGDILLHSGRFLSLPAYAAVPFCKGQLWQDQPRLQLRSTAPKTCFTDTRLASPALLPRRSVAGSKLKSESLPHGILPCYFLTREPPEPNVIHQPQQNKYRQNVRPARTHER